MVILKNVIDGGKPCWETVNLFISGGYRLPFRVEDRERLVEGLRSNLTNPDPPSAGALCGFAAALLVELMNQQRRIEQLEARLDSGSACVDDA